MRLTMSSLDEQLGHFVVHVGLLEQAGRLLMRRRHVHIHAHIHALLGLFHNHGLVSVTAAAAAAAAVTGVHAAACIVVGLEVHEAALHRMVVAPVVQVVERYDLVGGGGRAVLGVRGVVVAATQRH